MAKEWQHELKRHPKLLELESKLRKRRRQLQNDKQFVLESARLHTLFEGALTAHHQVVRSFFKECSHPLGVHLFRIHEFLHGVKDHKLRDLFVRYVRYVARFGVVIRLHRTKPSFSMEYLVPWGATFHVRLVKTHFEPADGNKDKHTPHEYFFESNNPSLPAAVKKQIEAGRIKFAQIEDDRWSSVLSKLEDFSYYADGLTFILHNAEQPYLFCLIGEKVSDETWRKASKVRSAFLKQYYGRGTAGRPPNIPRLRKAIEVRNEPGSLKSKVALHDTEAENFYSAYGYLSRVGKHLR